MKWNKIERAEELGQEAASTSPSNVGWRKPVFACLASMVAGMVLVSGLWLNAYTQREALLQNLAIEGKAAYIDPEGVFCIHPGF